MIASESEASGAEAAASSRQGGVILFDTCILIDILGRETVFTEDSVRLLRTVAPDRRAVGPHVYAELAVGYMSEDALANVLERLSLRRVGMSWAAAFAAGRAYAAYRARGGRRETILADFLIGAHAVTDGDGLATRDVGRYRTAFPHLRLVTP